MPINILMPALSPTMEKGNLAKWLKKEGEKVKPGDVIAEIETDKATMEVEAVDEGTLAKIVVPEGTTDVPVNQLIAVLAGEGEDANAAAAGAGSAPPPAPKVAPSSTSPQGEEVAARSAAGEGDSPRAQCVETPPHPDLLRESFARLGPASGEKGNLAPRSLSSSNCPLGRNA